MRGSLPLPGAARAQARRVRILVQLPEEPPELTPDAARALLHILLKAADKQKREADGATLRCLQGCWPRNAQSATGVISRKEVAPGKANEPWSFGLTAPTTWPARSERRGTVPQMGWPDPGGGRFP